MDFYKQLIYCLTSILTYMYKFWDFIAPKFEKRLLIYSFRKNPQLKYSYINIIYIDLAVIYIITIIYTLNISQIMKFVTDKFVGDNYAALSWLFVQSLLQSLTIDWQLIFLFVKFLLFYVKPRYRLFNNH